MGGTAGLREAAAGTEEKAWPCLAEGGAAALKATLPHRFLGKGI